MKHLDYDELEELDEEPYEPYDLEELAPGGEARGPEEGNGDGPGPGEAAGPEDSPERDEASGKRRRSPFRTMLRASGYLLMALVLAYLAVAIYLRVDARLGTDPAEEELPEEPLLYTQSDLDALLAEADEEAQARVLEAYENGAADGENRVLTAVMQGLSDGDGVLVTLRPFYPRHVVILSGGAYHFVPLMEQLRPSEVAEENVVILGSGEKQYAVDGEIVSHKGIDVSQYQGKIDWARVAGDGVEFAILRAGYRGYGAEGRLVEDETFGANMEAALENGVHVGAYFFSQAITEEEIHEEVRILLDQVGPYASGGIPLVIDVERDASRNYRTEVLTPAERTDLILAFCREVEAAGYQPFIYYNTEMSILYLELDRLEDYPKWYAYYSDTVFFPYYYDIWQYSDKGRVDGISGDVDLNFSITAFWEN